MSKRVRLAGLFGVATLAAAFLTSPVPAQQQPLAAADAVAAEIYAKTNSTGMVLVVVRDKEVHLQSFGESAPGSGRAPGADSLLRLCSLTKIFATDLLVKLSIDKTVRLDDPLQKFAPAGAKIPTSTLHGPAERAITLGDLATHTAGLPREIGPAPAGTPHFTFPDFAQRWAWLPRQKLRNSPGTVAAYSNVGFDLLGDALSAAAKKPYPQLLNERTTVPLGLKDTTFTPSAEQCSRMLLGHHAPRAHEPPVCTPTDESGGSAGLYSTANDMSRWLEYLLGVSDNAALRQNPAAQAVYVNPGDLAVVKGLDHAGEPSGIGLGWLRVGTPGDPGMIIQKTGGGGGFSTYIAMLPARHTGVFIALTEGGPWKTNPFYATNNLLLELEGLPPLPPPPDRLLATPRPATRRHTRTAGKSARPARKAHRSRAAK